MSNEDFETKIKEAIEQKGFLHELRVSKFLQKNEYQVANNLYYIDEDEGKGREVDMRAVRNYIFKQNEEEYFVRHCFLIECKKSINPWIVFTSNKTSYDSYGFMVHCRGFQQNDSWPKDRVTMKLSKSHPFSISERRGRSFSVLDKDSMKTCEDAIYKSLTTAVKATIATRNNEFGAGNREICFYYPLVIFDGTLYEAYLDNDNKTVLSKTDSVMVSFSYQSPKYPDERFVIPIITEQSLKKFSTHMNAILRYFGGLYESNLNWFYHEEDSKISGD